MNIYQFWKDVLEQNADAIKGYFDKNAYINWHCTNEQFNVDEFIIANCEYPGSWDGEVERLQQINDLFITVTHVYPKDKTQSFHVTSFIKVIDDKIAAVDEYWAEDGVAPKWRLDKHIGKVISKGTKAMKNTLLEQIKRKIASWDKTDIYAISLYVNDMNDNPCEPVVVLGYNTLEQFQKEIPNAYNAQEAKWNYAFWLQNEELSFGTGETQLIVRQWIESTGYSYFTHEEMFLSQEQPDESLYEGITTAFVEVLVEIAKELHESGFIKEQFGKVIPVLIHELEYYEEIAEQNLRANPTETVEDFVKFCLDES